MGGEYDLVPSSQAASSSLEISIGRVDASPGYQQVALACSILPVHFVEIRNPNVLDINLT